VFECKDGDLQKVVGKRTLKVQHPYLKLSPGSQSHVDWIALDARTKDLLLSVAQRTSSGGEEAVELVWTRINKKGKKK
jgi:hypothetical protein